MATILQPWRTQERENAFENLNYCFIDSDYCFAMSTEPESFCCVHHRPPVPQRIFDNILASPFFSVFLDGDNRK